MVYERRHPEDWRRACETSQRRADEQRARVYESLWPKGHRVALALLGLVGAGAFLWGINALPVLLS